MKRKVLLTFLALIVMQSAFSSPNWNIKNGIELVNNKKYDAAAKFFEGYLKSNPNDSDGHYYLGICYKNLNMLQKSSQHLQKSYELSRNLEKINVSPITNYDDSTEDDYLDMANMYFDSGDYKKAIQYADLMININPNSVNAFILKTKVYSKTGNQNQARVYFKKALMLDSSLVNSIWAKSLGVTKVPQYNHDYYNIKGLEYYYSADIKNAVKYFNKAIEMEGNNPAVYNNLALCYMKTNDFDNAKKALNKALRVDRNFNLTYINLAKLESLKSSLENKTGPNPKVEKYLNQAIKINPNNKHAYLELGNYYLQNKEYSLASKNFQNAILIDGNFFEALMGLGISYVEEGNLSDGIKVLRKASTIAKDGIKNPDMLYYLAKICIANSQFNEAKGYLLDAVRQNENKNYYFELGKIYFNEQDWASSENAFKKAMELDLDFELEADLYNYFGLIEYKNFDTEKAIYMFKKAVDLEPNRAMYLYNLAQAYKSLGNNDAYAKEINAIAGLKPKTVQDFLDFSTIYFDKKNTQTAIKILDDGISKYPEERSLYEAKLKLFKTAGDAKGIKDAEFAIRTKFKK